MTLLEKLLSVIEAVLQRPTASLSLDKVAEKDLSVVLKFCLLCLVVKVVPKLSLALSAYLAWRLARGG